MPTNRPAKHIVPYGIAGTGKSHFAASMPKPQFVAMFDPIGKETPYTDGLYIDTYSDVDVKSLKHPTMITLNGQLTIIPTWDCFADIACEKFIRRIVWFHDPDNTKPQAYNSYAALQPKFERIFKDLEIETFILDSITTVCAALRNKFQSEGVTEAIGNQKLEAGPRGWANLATEELEWINGLINSLTINTVTICHSDYNMSANRNPEIPQVTVHAYGRMRERLLITSGDVYRTFYDGKNYKLAVSADQLHVGNNSLKISGVFNNNWEEITQEDKTNVHFVRRERT